MKLTEFQEKLIDKLVKNKTFDTDSLVSFLEQNKFVKSVTPEKGKCFHVKGHNFKEGYICDSEDTTLQFIAEAISLWKLLESYKLVYIYKDTKRDAPAKLLTTGDNSSKFVSNDRLLTVLEPWRSKVILCYGDLEEFQKRNYTTIEEEQYQDEKEKRTRGLFWTKVIGVGTIIVGLLNVTTNCSDCKNNGNKSKPIAGNKAAIAIDKSRIDSFAKRSVEPGSSSSHDTTAAESKQLE